MIGRSILLNVEEVLMPEDKQLLKRMRCGDKDALRQIYEKYRDDLFTVAVSLLRDVHASEDCLQEVFVNFAAAVDSLRIRHNLKGYLVSCVANRARDHLRKQTVQLNCSLEQLGPLAVNSDPANEVSGHEELEQVFEALAKLPYEQRETFVLHVQGEIKFSQIANLQNVSVRTVQSRYRYGIEKLRTILGGKRP